MMKSIPTSSPIAQSAALGSSRADQHASSSEAAPAAIV